MMNEVTARKEITDVLRGFIGVPERLLTEENAETWLTGHLFGLSGNDMAYLFFELEKRLGIQFSEEDVIGYRFCNIDGIIQTVCGKTGAT